MRLAPHAPIALSLVISLSIALAASSANATNRNWVNGSGGSASTPGNWSPAGLPVAADWLFFTIPGTYSVAWDGTVTASTVLRYQNGTVTNTFSAPHTTSSLVVGYVSGDDPLAILSSGTVISSGFSTIASGEGSEGRLRVTGPTARFEMNPNQDLTVGNNGDGDLDVLDAGVVRVARTMYVGNFAGTSGSVLVSGRGAAPPFPASTLEIVQANGALVLGNSGNGFLNVTDGGEARIAGDLLLGKSAGALGSLLIGGGTNPPAVFVADDCGVGNDLVDATASGTGSIDVDGGQVVVSDRLLVGDPLGGSGALFLRGGLMHTRNLVVDAGDDVHIEGGTLRIDGGTGTIAAGGLDLGGTIEAIRGAQVAIFGDQTVGSADFGTPGFLRVDSGSDFRVLSGNLSVGAFPGSVDVDSSSYLLCESLFFGSTAAATMHIGVGSGVDCVYFESADEPSGTATIDIAGAGANLNFGGQMYLSGDVGGPGGPTTMTIGSGGLVTGSNLLSDGTIFGPALARVNTGGSLQVGDQLLIQGTVHANGGDVGATRITLAGNGKLTGRGLVTGEIASLSASTRIVAESGTLVVGNVASASGYQFAGTLDVGSASVFLRSASAITLGDTTRIAGGSLLCETDVSLPTTGFLIGRGDIEVPQLTTNGTLSIEGAVGGLLHVEGNWTQSGDGWTVLRARTPQQTDRVDVSGHALLAGRLRLVFPPDVAIPANTPITLMSFGTYTFSLVAIEVVGIDPSLVEFTLGPDYISFFLRESVAAEKSPVRLELLARLGLGARPEFVLALPEASAVTIELFDVRGRRVAEIAVATLDPGHYRYEIPADVRRGIYWGRAWVRAHSGAPPRSLTARVLVP